MKKTTQRIKLRQRGHPVKLDATIVEMSEDGRKLLVRFDGPLEDLWLYWWGESLIDVALEGDEVPASRADCKIWEVL